MVAVTLTIALLNPVAAAMVEDLGSESFPRREAASRALTHLGPLAYPRLELALDSPDAEIASRARWILRDAWLRCPDPLVLPTAWTHLPWIDSLPNDYPNKAGIVQDYLSLADRNRPNVAGDLRWPNYRHATAALVRDLLAAGQKPADVRRLLDRMVEFETGWLAKNP